MTRDEFTEGLRQLLPNLYDPAYRAPESIERVLRQTGAADTLSTSDIVIAQIQALRPGPRIPQTARIHRLYEVLHLRYVEHWTQRRVAEELGITVRHLSREQARAIAFLADRLWRDAAPEQETATDRQAALSESLASLEHGEGENVSDLGSALRRASKLATVVAESHDATITVAPSSPGIMVGVRWTVLVQVLVRALTQLVSRADGGEIQVQARMMGHSGMCHMMTDRYAGEEPSAQDLSNSLVQSQHGKIEFERTTSGAEIRVSFPLARKHTVLVIDDNPDLLHYYQQCVVNAPYDIHGITVAAHAVEHALELQPDIIVLDLMLPDTDGWDILEQLREQESLAAVPIIISSVINEEELAMALGATLCLTKPVRRATFVQGLDAALLSRA